MIPLLSPTMYFPKENYFLFLWRVIYHENDNPPSIQGIS